MDFVFNKNLDDSDVNAKWEFTGAKDERKKTNEKDKQADITMNTARLQADPPGCNRQS